MTKLKDMPPEKQITTLKIALAIAVVSIFIMMLSLICVTCIIHSCSQMIMTY